MAEEEFDRQTGLGRQTGEGIRQFIIVRWTGDDRLDRQSSEKTLPEREVFLKQQGAGTTNGGMRCLQVVLLIDQPGKVRRQIPAWSEAADSLGVSSAQVAEVKTTLVKRKDTNLAAVLTNSAFKRA